MIYVIGMVLSVLIFDFMLSVFYWAITNDFQVFNTQTIFGRLQLALILIGVCFGLFLHATD